jgi:hypothetical protein
VHLRKQHERFPITKTDPVTFTAEEIGWYAVHVNANDVATMGARPLWFQTCLLFPTNTTETEIRQIFLQIDMTCQELGIAVTGGHTEVTNAVPRPVVIGDMHGLVAQAFLPRRRPQNCVYTATPLANGGLSHRSPRKVNLSMKTESMMDNTLSEVVMEPEHLLDFIEEFYCC